MGLFVGLPVGDLVVVVGMTVFARSFDVGDFVVGDCVCDCVCDGDFDGDCDCDGEGDEDEDEDVDDEDLLGSFVIILVGAEVGFIEGAKLGLIVVGVSVGLFEGAEVGLIVIGLSVG